jgi:hypothetical protein
MTDEVAIVSAYDVGENIGAPITRNGVLKARDLGKIPLVSAEKATIAVSEWLSRFDALARQINGPQRPRLINSLA